MTPKFKRMAQVYKYFAREHKTTADFSDDAKRALFEWESVGTGKVAANNGYAIGKSLLDITVTLWREDLERRLLFAHELYLQYPKWFVDKVVGRHKLTDAEIQDVENRVGHLHRTDFDNLDSGDKQFYFDYLNIQAMHNG